MFCFYCVWMCVPVFVLHMRIRHMEREGEREGGVEGGLKNKTKH